MGSSGRAGGARVVAHVVVSTWAVQTAASFLAAIWAVRCSWGTWDMLHTEYLPPHCRADNAHLPTVAWLLLCVGGAALSRGKSKCLRGVAGTGNDDALGRICLVNLTTSQEPPCIPSHPMPLATGCMLHQYLSTAIAKKTWPTTANLAY
jgi:hypothetical protein